MAGQVSTTPVIEKAQAALLVKRVQLSKDGPTKLNASLPKIPQQSETSKRLAREYDRQQQARDEQKKRDQIDRLIQASLIPTRHLHGRPKKEGPWWEKAQVLQNWLGGGYLISLLGKRGTGKTQLGVYLILRACRAMMSSRYTKALDIFLDIRTSYKHDGPSEQERIAYWVRPALLVIDELQERGESAWEDRMLVHIIDKRYDACRDTVLISNLTKAEFVSAVGISISTRIQECGGHVVCDWPSFRGIKP